MNNQLCFLLLLIIIVCCSFHLNRKTIEQFNESKIPNIIHFVFGLEKQKEEFLFPYYLAIYSAKIINNPNKIYFHYHYEPSGKWWNEAKKLVVLNKVDIPTHFGRKKINLSQIDSGYNFDSQLRIKFVVNKFKIDEIPIETFYRDEHSNYHIKYSLNFFKELFFYR